MCPECKRVLVENGAMQVLSSCLQSASCSQEPRILYNCLLTLRNLSDCAIREDNLELLIKRLIELLNTTTSGGSGGGGGPAAAVIDANVSICAA